MSPLHSASDLPVVVTDEMKERALLMGTRQAENDVRYGWRNPSQRLGIKMHTYAHDIAEHFAKYAKDPREYKRTLASFLNR